MPRSIQRLQKINSRVGHYGLLPNDLRAFRVVAWSVVAAASARGRISLTRDSMSRFMSSARMVGEAVRAGTVMPSL